MTNRNQYPFHTKHTPTKNDVYCNAAKDILAAYKTKTTLLHRVLVLLRIR